MRSCDLPNKVCRSAGLFTLQEDGRGSTGLELIKPDWMALLIHNSPFRTPGSFSLNRISIFITKLALPVIHLPLAGPENG
ncbi:hypothetical protein AAK899_06575 [Erysipelotrichaceae bacterium 51-3]